MCLFSRVKAARTFCAFLILQVAERLRKPVPSIFGSLIGIDRLSLQISQNPMYLKISESLSVPAVVSAHPFWGLHKSKCMQTQTNPKPSRKSNCNKAARAAWTVSLKHQPHSSRLHLLHSAAWPCKTLAKSVMVAICRLSALLLRLCFGCGEFKFAQDQLAPLPLQNLKMSWCLVLHTLPLTSQVTAHRSIDKMKNAPQ